MATAPPWLSGLSLEALADKLGPQAMEAVLSHGLRYVRGPSYESGAVTATLAETRHGERVDHTVKLWGVASAGHRVFQECSCGRWANCLHVPALMLDLSISAPLRQAALSNSDPSLALATLGALRAEAHRAHVVEQIAARWLPVASVEHRAAPEYSLVLPVPEGTSALQHRALSFDGSAGFELRLRVAGQRALVDPSEVQAAAFPSADRQVLSLCNALGGGRKGYKVSGTDASLVLHLLRARTVRHEASGERIRFEDTVLTPEIVSTQLPRSALAMAVRGAQIMDAADADTKVAALEGRWRGGDVDVSARETALFRGPYSFVWVPSRWAMFPCDATVDTDVAWHLQLAPAVELVTGHEREIMQRLRRALRGRNLSLSAGGDAHAPERPGFVMRIDGEPLRVTATLEANYKRGSFEVTPVDPMNELMRDADAERAAIEAMGHLGFAFNPADRVFCANDDDAAAFWSRGVQSLDALREQGWEILVPERFATTRVTGRLPVKIELSTTRGMLDVQLEAGGGSRRDLAAMLRALRRKERWVQLDDGALAEITASLRDALSDLDELSDETTERATLPLHQLGRVEFWRESGVAVSASGSVAALRRAMIEGVEANEIALPEGFLATLRPYQHAALAWLDGLVRAGTGGVLADDMGLGKTVVALALLAVLKARDGVAPSLVVCPTSVAPNWVAEAAKFAPTLRVLSLHGLSGAQRATALEGVAACDLVVTSYALLRLDAEALAGVQWRLAVLDEAQSIKNASAASTRAAKGLHARARLCLTGTPVENRLAELWSVMDVANPGILGTRRGFERAFERPIAQGDDPSRVKLLRALVRPFMLRRTKREVLTELPPRTESDLRCTLSNEHRTRYDALAAVLRKEMRASTRQSGREGRGIAVLTALLRLRQMACDPRLIDPTASAAGGKREVFVERVKTLAAAGRRVLVFSQFVELLTLWRKDLDAEGIAYAWLDGATTDRQREIARFQAGEVPVFMVSLRAGGTGLNLTAADTVIHCDPWWNPAVEDQATDRAHRMGQTRAVSVYRLIAQGTVEDAVVQMKARKRAVADAVIREESGVFQSLTDEDLDDLFAGSRGVIQTPP